MTAEIAIINRSGIALAADSAVTIGKQRVWKTTNKLFSLSPKNDIGIMVYGSGDFVGYPWDTVIKEFRRSPLHTRFDTVKDASEAFVAFLKDKRFDEAHTQAVSIWSLFVEVAEQLKESFEYDGKLEFRDQFKRIAVSHIEAYSNAPVCLEISLDTFRATYLTICVDLFKDVFKETFTKPMQSIVGELCFEVFRRGIGSSYVTGLVIAGFGHNELLPHVRNYAVDGRHGENLRCWLEDDRDMNTKPQSGGAIWPFGQADIAYLFMEGISSGQEQYIAATLSKILKAKSEDLVKNYVPDGERLVELKLQHNDDETVVVRFMEEFQKYRRERQVDPVLEVVSTLPKEEMAAMAEALVDITSLRRKVDSRIETVAGPIDVAFISKGDGFIWMKRKHYFDIALNGDFIARKQKELSGGSDAD